MANAQELLLIREIIADGFDDLEAISFEMDIPMVTLLNIKRQIIREKSIQERKEAVERQKLERKELEKRAEVIDKIEMLRRNYERIYNGLDANAGKRELPVEIPDNPAVELAIKRMESVIEGIRDRKERLKRVLGEINSIMNEQMSLEQANRIVSILMDRQNLPVPQGVNDKTQRYLYSTYRSKIVKKLVDGVKTRAALTDDIEELKSLSRILSADIERVDYTVVSSIRANIQSKITRIQTEKRNYEMEHEFPKNIISIIENLVSKDINEEALGSAIDSEVQRRISTSTIKFSDANTPERQRVQVYYRVIKALAVLANEYPIQSADRVMSVLEKMFHMGFDSNFRAVINNYIERNEMVAARYLCDRFNGIYGADTSCSNSIQKVRGDILRAEIGQIILRGIQANASEKAKKDFIDVFERRMKEHRYSYSLIPLGRTKDGMKKITLQDIWGEDREQRR